ncbi:hypothetical protein BLS_009242 [Venturia inaequalis]|uniref:Uncharacterized protein n=1 Tax=Venturia inaequalis TaxID=5025 RepID=A0A8H3YK40_VENIN|nr:hypothetical protein BLS_009242 [Venturia inaequalis]KAE9965646.1 hypothetical protein EG328_009500 [Venturia inaequalis]
MNQVTFSSPTSRGRNSALSLVYSSTIAASFFPSISSSAGLAVNQAATSILFNIALSLNLSALKLFAGQPLNLDGKFDIRCSRSRAGYASNRMRASDKDTAYQRQDPKAKPMLEPMMKGRAAVPVNVAENMAKTMPNMAAVVVPAIMLRNMLWTGKDELSRMHYDG